MTTNFRADYWKSQGRKFCDFCKCWIADNKPSIDFHEGGKKHKENVGKRLKEIHKNSAKRAKQARKLEEDIKKMENAAMAAYLKDVENNTRDMTADRIIKEKLDKTESKDTMMIDRRPATAAPETVPRFKSKNYQFSREIDPCDPSLSRSGTTSHQGAQPRVGYHQGGENKPQGKTRPAKGKGKGKKTQEDDRPSKPIQKLWYEARSPEGYTYYWHIETNESVWEPPEEGYMTFAEQEDESKEQALQEELLEQLEKEKAAANAEILEEKRANDERERMRGLKREAQRSDDIDDPGDEVKEAGEGGEGEKEETTIPYRRDYSIPEKSHPYGPWRTVQPTEKKPMDLQLPRQKQIQLPTFVKSEPPPPQRVFKEKTIARVQTGDSDDDGKQPIAFKKRKIGNKSVRQRSSDE